jgi:hypothetical protein
MVAVVVAVFVLEIVVIMDVLRVVVLAHVV